MGVLAILQIVNAMIPTVTNLITVIRHKDGTTTTLVLLDEADAQFADNQAQVTAWLQAHNKPVPGPVTNPTPTPTPKP